MLWISKTAGLEDYFSASLYARDIASPVCFTPEAIEKRIIDRETKNSEINEVLSAIQKPDTKDIVTHNVDLDEDKALKILVAKLSFNEVLCLKLPWNTYLAATTWY